MPETSDGFPDANIAPPPPACVEEPVPRARGGALIRFDVEVTLGGKPIIFGEKNALASGGTLTPTNLRFYLSDLALGARSGALTPVDLVASDGQPVPYNVHLVSLESSSSLRFHLQAPPGRYERLGFVFGLNDTCNASDPARRRPPLTNTSQMTWPQPGSGLGYLFLRLEGQVSGANAPAPPGVIHMGGFIGLRFAPVLTVPADIEAVVGQTRSVRLRVALDQILAGAMMPANVENFHGPPSPEIIAGEHLRQNANKVTIFEASPAP